MEESIIIINRSKLVRETKKISLKVAPAESDRENCNNVTWSTVSKIIHE